VLIEWENHTGKKNQTSKQRNRERGKTETFGEAEKSGMIEILRTSSTWQMIHVSVALDKGITFLRMAECHGTYRQE
jgi:hypothetical protein